MAAGYERSNFMNDSVDFHSNGSGMSSPTYDSATDSVKLDHGTLTFENPGYLSLGEQPGISSTDVEPVILNNMYENPFDFSNNTRQTPDANKKIENNLFLNSNDADVNYDDFNRVQLVVD